MITKTLKATSLALVAVVSFATVASTPVSAKGHGPVRSGGFHGPVHGIGSSHNPRPGPHFSRFPSQGIGRLSGLFPPSGINRFPPPRIIPFPPATRRTRWRPEGWADARMGGRPRNGHGPGRRLWHGWPGDWRRGRRRRRSVWQRGRLSRPFPLGRRSSYDAFQTTLETSM